MITRYEAGRYVSKLKVHWPFPSIEEFIPLICIYFLLKRIVQLLFLMFETQGTFHWIYLRCFSWGLVLFCVLLSGYKFGHLTHSRCNVTSQACPKNATSPQGRGEFSRIPASSANVCSRGLSRDLSHSSHPVTTSQEMPGQNKTGLFC